MDMDGNTRAAIARNIKMLRESIPLSQTQLAAKAGVGQTSISNMEQPDGKSPTSDTLDCVARALRVPPWVLMLPHIPSDPEMLKQLEKLALTYLTVDDAGRRTIDTIAEAEARYFSKTIA
jgi:transcriptional regulator with XRE-family HTH domain